MSPSITTYVYDFTGVTDNTYGLTAFVDPNDITVTWSNANVAPTNDSLALDLTGASYKDTKPLLCGKQDYLIVSKHSDGNGVTNIAYVILYIDPAGKNIS